jgi:vancomycin permeability regulator SanA
MLVITAIYIEARTATPQQADAIVVLGAAQYNGNPTGVFRARLDTALQLWNDGYAPVIILTGGKMPGDVYTEAETGVQYLLDRGVPSSALLWENQGRDTWQSMQGVDEVLDGTGVDLLRTELMARSLGFSASGAASENSPIQPWSGTEFSYVIRETGGIFVNLPNLLGF